MESESRGIENPFLVPDLLCQRDGFMGGSKQPLQVCRVPGQPEPGAQRSFQSLGVANFASELDGSLVQASRLVRHFSEDQRSNERTLQFGARYAVGLIKPVERHLQ